MQDPESPAPAVAIDWRALLIESLGLAPTEGEADVSDAAITARMSEVIAAAGKLPDIETQVGTAAENLTALQAQFDQVRGELDAKSTELQGLYTARTEAEIDAILEQFAARLTTPEAKARIRALLLSDRESGMDILNGLPEAAAETDDTPPDPQHDPESEQASGPTEAEIATAIGNEARRIQSGNPKLPYGDAWAQAEKTIRARVASSQPL